MEDLLQYLRGTESPLAYLVLGLSAAFEYVFPPFPGDTVILFGAFLAATADYRPVAVYVALTIGSVVGGMGAYAFGRLFDDPERWPRFLRSKRARWAFKVLKDRFDRYGSMYLAANRFLPALRAFFFVAAGVTRMNPWSVLIFGGLSAAVWNALILAVGYAVGRNWELLLKLSERYTIGALVVVGLLIVVAVLRARWSRRRRRT
jgi:membrane protein DedA with SNARE-associated domain